MTTYDQLEPVVAAAAPPIPPEVLAARDAAQRSLERAKTAAWQPDAPNPIEAYDCAIRAVEQVLAGVAYPLTDATWTLDNIIERLRADPFCWETRTDGIHSVRVFTDLLDDLWNAKQHYTRPDRDCEPVEDARDAVTIAEAIVALIQRDFLEWWGPINLPNDDDDDSTVFATSEAEFDEIFADVFGRPWSETP